MDRETESIYEGLLRVLSNLQNATNYASKINDKRMHDARGFMKKLLNHCCTLFYLRRGTTIPEIEDAQRKFVDLTSIDLIARAVIETFLVFHYVFVQPKSYDEADLRYWIWKLSGLLSRQRVIKEYTDPEVVNTKMKDTGSIIELTVKIESSDLFARLTEKQQRRVL